MCVAIPRVPDTAVYLDALGGHVVGRVRGIRLRTRRRDLAVVTFRVGGPRRVVHADAGKLDLAQHVDCLVPSHLELRQRLAEHLPVLRVVERQLVGGLAHPDQLGGDEHAGVVEHSAPDVGVIAGRPDRASRASRGGRSARTCGSRRGWRPAARRNRRSGTSGSPHACAPGRAPSCRCTRREPWVSRRRACSGCRDRPRARARVRPGRRSRLRRGRPCPVRCPRRARPAGRRARARGRRASRGSRRRRTGRGTARDPSPPARRLRRRCRGRARRPIRARAVRSIRGRRPCATPRT